MRGAHLWRPAMQPPRHAFIASSQPNIRSRALRRKQGSVRRSSRQSRRRATAPGHRGDMRAPLERYLAAFIRRVPPALIAAVLCAQLGMWARAETLDERFVDGLRQRQLLSLAEKYCRAALVRQDLPIERRAEMSIELSRCL